MLICHLTESFGGGVARHITDIIKNGNFANHVLIYSTERKDTDKKKIDFLKETTNIPIFELPMGGVKALSAIPDLRKLLGDIKPDVLHIHSSFAGMTGRLAAKDFEFPVIYTPHGFAFLRVTDPFKILYALIERNLSKYTDKIIAVSNSEKLIAIKNGIAEEKIIVIENGINDLMCDYNKTELRREWGISNKEVVICTLGRPGKQKGYDLLKKVISKVSKKITDDTKLRFIIPMNTDFKNISVILNKSVIIDFVSALDKPSVVLALSDIYISTARWEGGPYGILEAMQHKLPVIASDIPGNCDYVINQETGLLLPPSCNEFANAVIMLSLNSELRDKLGESGEIQVKNIFSLRNMLLKYTNLLNGLI